MGQGDRGEQINWEGKGLLDNDSYVVNSKFKGMASVRTPLLFPDYPLPWGQALKKNLFPTSGDINAFFAVMLDNIANLFTIYTVLVYVFKMPADVVQKEMFPGTALGVMLGCLALAFAAIYVDRHNRETQTPDGEPFIVTAIPLGLDAPSTIGLPLIVIGPAYSAALAAGKSENDAAHEAWAYGCAVVVMIGVLKAVLAIFGEKLQHVFHAAGKQGALASIGLALLGFYQLTNVLQEPAPGLISLWFLLLVVINRYDEYNRAQPFKLPFRISGVLVTAIIGCAIFYSMVAAKITITEFQDPFGTYDLAYYPRPVNFFSYIKDAIVRYGPIAIPYAILVNMGGLTVVAGAKAEGNDYSVTAVQMIDAVCTLISGFCGGVTQTTPYIGHTVYHRSFKCRSFYTVANGLFIGLGGLFGYIALFSELLPKWATLPIFIFVAFEIVSSTFHDESSPKSILSHHAPAIVLSFFPALAQVMQIYLSQLYGGQLMSSALNPGQVATNTGLDSSIIALIGVIIVLAHGFIATSLLWGSALAFVIDRKTSQSALMLLICAILAFFGVMHSCDPNGKVYAPWKLEGEKSALPYHWAAGYLVMSAMTALSPFFIKPDEDNGYDS